jgi:patatin-like phospholipase/acyl hydrolase
MQPVSEDKNHETKRILALDGGGLRGFFTLEVLARVEALLRQRSDRPTAVLADHFDLIAGTSIGAIFGALLSWGHSVADVQELFSKLAARVFRPYRNPFMWLVNRYNAKILSDSLKEIFVEKGAEGTLNATLGTSLLQTVFLAVVRNASTGSAWPICSHPALRYNRRGESNCNLDIPLWQIVRASAAAPIYFAPEGIRTGEETFRFVDGGITPYNNPALIAALMVTEPCFNINWPKGEDQLYVLSVGTGRTRVRYPQRDNLFGLGIPAVVSKTITALIEGTTDQQDLLCRVLGRCLHGPVLDREVGDLIEHTPTAEAEQSQRRRFTYVRYNTDFNSPEFEPILRKYGGNVPMNLLTSIPALQALGKRYAETEVLEEHLR